MAWSWFKYFPFFATLPAKFMHFCTSYLIFSQHFSYSELQWFRWEKIKIFIKRILDFWSKVFLILFRWDKVPFNQEHNDDFMWQSKERRLSKITSRFLTLSSTCFTTLSIVNWNVSVRLLNLGVEKKALSFIWIHFQTILIVPIFHC